MIFFKMCGGKINPCWSMSAYVPVSPAGVCCTRLFQPVGVEFKSTLFSLSLFISCYFGAVSTHPHLHKCTPGNFWSNFPKPVWLISILQGSTGCISSPAVCSHFSQIKPHPAQRRGGNWCKTLFRRAYLHVSLHLSLGTQIAITCLQIAANLCA